MALNIRNDDVEQLAAKLAKLTGESKTAAVARALRERLERVQRGRRGRRLADELNAIAQRCARLPQLDGRSAEDIIGYDEHGLVR